MDKRTGDLVSSTFAQVSSPTLSNDTDHYLEVAKIREGLAVNKESSYSFLGTC
jgi:hypothetical protein